MGILFLMVAGRDPQRVGAMGASWVEAVIGAASWTIARSR
jgi:hypothetical protein